VRKQRGAPFLGGFLVVQGVRAGGVLANGGRHVKTERYRGRHRKASAHISRGTGVRVAVTVTVACAALFICLPQPSWADRTGAVAAAAHSTAAARVTATAQVMVKSLPGPFRLICSTRLAGNAPS
jgi:hypothetical protein